MNQLSREDRLRYSANDEQLFGILANERIDGAARGLRVLSAYTAGGLSYDVLPDNALDIQKLTYKGVNLSYFSKVGLTRDYYLHENDFSNYYSGGLLYTCGLLSTGPANVDNGTYHPLHGRLHALKANHLSVSSTENDLSIAGDMREAALFGHALRMHRTITSPAFGAEIVIRDVVENLMPEPIEYMILYHMNFGYPFLSEHLKLILPEDTVTTPRTPFAAEAIDTACEFTKPVDGIEERVYFHDVPAENGYSRVKLHNEILGIGVELTCKKDTLPQIVEWKSMKSGDYALGIEPSNSFINGRAQERENGTLRSIAPFGKEELEVRIRFYDV